MMLSHRLIVSQTVKSSLLSSASANCIYILHCKPEGYLRKKESGTRRINEARVTRILLRTLFSDELYFISLSAARSHVICKFSQYLH